METSATVIASQRKSDKLTPAELNACKKLAKRLGTQQDQADYFGIKKSTYLIIMLKNGQGSPDSISKIREKLNA